MSEENLKEKLTKEVMTTVWEPLEPHHERGAIYLLDEDLDMVEVGEAMANDSVVQIKRWLEDGLLYPPTKDEIDSFKARAEELKMLIIEPYVLIQRKALS